MTIHVAEIEKTLRHIELKRLFDNPGDTMAPDQMAETSEWFMEYSLASGDWRFLNAALKLNDWLRDRGHPQAALLTARETECLARLRRACGLV